MISLETVLTGLAAALVTALFGYLGIARRATSDETSLALEAWKELVEPLKQELRATKEEVARLNLLLAEQAIVHSQETAKLLAKIRELSRSLSKFQQDQKDFNDNNDSRS